METFASTETMVNDAEANVAFSSQGTWNIQIQSSWYFDIIVKACMSSHAKIDKNFANYFLKTKAKTKDFKVLKLSCLGLHKIKSDLEL